MSIYDGPIKVYIGSTPDGLDAEAQMVAEYSIRKNTDKEVDIHWMILSNDPDSFWYAGIGGGENTPVPWQTRTWPTPFSGFRWGIPAACNYEGQAIYMDHDMMILADLNELWEAPWDDGTVVQSKGGWRMCVCKWHCERAKEVLLPIDRLKALPDSHQRTFNMFAQNPQLIQVFNRQWNNFDGENDKLEDVKILHYTDMSTQPHGKYVVPRITANGQTHWFDGEFRTHRREDVIAKFDELYEAALTDGYTVEQYVPPKEEWFGMITKQSQAGYHAANGFDVTRGE